MRAAVDRFSSLLVGWVPDLSQAPPRRRLTIGALVSLLLHLLFFACIILATMVLPEHVERAVPAPDHRTLEVELRPVDSSPDDVPTVANNRPVLDTSGLKQTAKPENATFESDKDMRAASQLPARGTMPLPSQDGRSSVDSPTFADQEVRLSAIDTTVDPGQEGTPATAPPQQADQQTAAQPAPAPLFTPQPVAKEDLSKATTAQPQQTLPEPAKQALATPPPLEKVAVPRPDQLAVTKPSAETKPGPITRLQVASMSTPPRAAPKTKPTWMAMLSTPRPLSAQSAAQRYQEELRKTRIDGEISNRGEAAVDAIATPAGRWKAMVRKSIGHNWRSFLGQQKIPIEPGRVVVAYTVDTEGKVHDLHVEEGGGENRALEAICLKAIEETPIPPPPDGMAEPYPDRRIPDGISFNLYSL